MSFSVCSRRIFDGRFCSFSHTFHFVLFSPSLHVFRYCSLRIDPLIPPNSRAEIVHVLNGRCCLPFWVYRDRMSNRNQKSVEEAVAAVAAAVTAVVAASQKAEEEEQETSAADIESDTDSERVEIIVQKRLGLQELR